MRTAVIVSAIDRGLQAKPPAKNSSCFLIVDITVNIFPDISASLWR
jgi:hypothetical protein